MKIQNPETCLGTYISKDDGHGNENGKKSKRFRLAKKTTLHVHHAFLYISLSSLHDYDVKLSDFTFSGGHEHKTTTLFFFS